MRLIILLASVVVQLCLGGLYAWTTFVPDLKSSYGLSTAQTQVIFGTSIAVFSITMVFSGRVLESKGPRLLLILSGVLFAAGYVIASLSGGTFLLLLLGISVIAGIATGLGYICPLSVCMRWFPQHKGLVTGIAVAGFGGGAILLASSVELLLVRGVDVLMIFQGVGVLFGIVILAASVVIRFPFEQSNKPTPVALLNKAIVKDPFFWALAGAMFSGTFAGLLVIGNLMPMAIASGITPASAVVAISTFAFGNAMGRIIWGRVADKWKTKSIQISLLFLAATLVGLMQAVSHVVFFIAISFLIGIGFGASFVIHATLVASWYGVNRVGNVYPLIFLSYGTAGITGPAIGGWLYDFTGRYSSSIVVSIIVVFIGLLISGLLVRQAERAAVYPGMEVSK